MAIGPGACLYTPDLTGRAPVDRYPFLDRLHHPEVGELIFGNNSGSKWSLDRTYLRSAEDTALLSVRLMTWVRSISLNGDGRYVLHCERIDARRS